MGNDCQRRLICSVPLRTGSGLNDREHWRVRARRVESEKYMTGLFIIFPIDVYLTRISPANACGVWKGLDSDNLAGSMKSVRDTIARWLGVDDALEDRVRYRCEQARGKLWQVLIEWSPRQSADIAKPVA
jgi:hypothetical protein